MFTNIIKTTSCIIIGSITITYTTSIFISRTSTLIITSLGEFTATIIIGSICIIIASSLDHTSSYRRTISSSITTIIHWLLTTYTIIIWIFTTTHTIRSTSISFTAYNTIPYIHYSIWCIITCFWICTSMSYWINT